MIDLPPAGYVPIGWTASQFWCNVIIILGVIGVIAFLRSPVK